MHCAAVDLAQYPAYRLDRLRICPSGALKRVVSSSRADPTQVPARGAAIRQERAPGLSDIVTVLHRPDVDPVFSVPTVTRSQSLAAVMISYIKCT